MEYAGFEINDIRGKQLNMSRQSMAGHAIGIMLLETWHPLLPGSVANATTFNFPVRLKILRDAKVEQIMSGDPVLIEMIIKAGRELEQEGVRAIVGGCGYFANYQREVAAALNIPVFLSSLLQVPVILRALKPGQQVGLLVADSKALNQQMLEACGITSGMPIVCVGMEDQPEFRNILECSGKLNYDRYENEVVGRAQKLVVENPNVNAILLECSEFPSVARSVQRAVKLPVWDYISMINWIYHGVVQRVYKGFF
ncbi:MAG: hypothetical protein APR62_01235 [Smithella sp. SDB]|nr:MAG: hypothetical protein APR62_01235 [Smithella sp. SDB]